MQRKGSIHHNGRHQTCNAVDANKTLSRDKNDCLLSHADSCSRLASESKKKLVHYLGHKIAQHLVTSCDSEQNHNYHGTPWCALLQGKLVVCIRTILYLDTKPT